MGVYTAHCATDASMVAPVTLDTMQGGATQLLLRGHVEFKSHLTLSLIGMESMNGKDAS